MRTARRRKNHQRTAAEQLDYDMELHRAQREGREEEFKQEEREKLRARTAARLDAEMDDYFSSRPKKDDALAENGEDENKTPPESATFDKSGDGNGSAVKLSTNTSINALVNDTDDHPISFEGVAEN